jgi:hypothetical protein
MMSSDQIKNVAHIYRILLNSEENRDWTDVDTLIEQLSWIDDDQLHREADVIYEIHKKGNVKCLSEHPKEQCVVPKMVEAVGAILDLYRETGQLHINNKYILQYYLAYSQAQMIIVY